MKPVVVQIAPFANTGASPPTDDRYTLLDATWGCPVGQADRVRVLLAHSMRGRLCST